MENGFPHLIFNKNVVMWLKWAFQMRKGVKSVDLQKYTFGLIDVEHNYIEPRRTQIRELLTSNGYVYIRENQFDDCYKHNSII